MNKKDLEFLKALCEAPSPSGYEVPAANLLRERLANQADEIETNVLGSVHATLKGKGGGPSVMIAGHIDEVGLMVKYITDDGFIYFDAIGGVDAAILPGMRVNVYATGKPDLNKLAKANTKVKAKSDDTDDGKNPELTAELFDALGYDAKAPYTLLRGVMGRKPIHLIEPDERKSVTKLDTLFIDIGLSGKAAKELIRVGDSMTYGVGFEEYGDGYAVARAFDDKLGVWIAVRVLEELRKAGRAKGDFIAAGTVQEEIGLRGGITTSYGVNPQIGISAEVGHATDYPGIAKTTYGESICGKGPLIARGPNINPVLFERLLAAADAVNEPYQIGPEARGTGTDANAIQLSRGGKVAGLISIPLRYMHTPTEVLKLKDVESAVKILTRFVLDLDETVDFTPR